MRTGPGRGRRRPGRGRGSPRRPAGWRRFRRPAGSVHRQHGHGHVEAEVAVQVLGPQDAGVDERPATHLGTVHADDPRAGARRRGAARGPGPAGCRPGRATGSGRSRPVGLPAAVEAQGLEPGAPDPLAAEGHDASGADGSSWYERGSVEPAGRRGSGRWPRRPLVRCGRAPRVGPGGSPRGSHRRPARRARRARPWPASATGFGTPTAVEARRASSGRHRRGEHQRPVHGPPATPAQARVDSIGTTLTTVRARAAVEQLVEREGDALGQRPVVVDQLAAHHEPEVDAARRS